MSTSKDAGFKISILEAVSLLQTTNFSDRGIKKTIPCFIVSKPLKHCNT